LLPLTASRTWSISHTGSYRITAPIRTSIAGLRLVGTSQFGTYFTASAGVAFDMLRVSHQLYEVTGLIFRPATLNQIPIRVYGPRTYIHDNYLLAAANNGGIGLLLPDTDPVSNVFVACAYARQQHDR
jgi:hypothetical protein